jgi:hypothetical protein
VAKKNSGGLFGALTMKQTDALARTISKGARNLMAEIDKSGTNDHGTVHELFDVARDLHESWTARADQGEYPGISARYCR